MNEPVIVSLRQCPDYNPDRVLARMRDCLQPLGGMRAVVQPGQRVLLKPNLLGNFAVERAVTTHPSVVRAAIQLVQEAGGTAFVGDSPAMASLAQTAEGCGLGSVLAETGASLLDLSEEDEFEVPGHAIVPKLVLARALRDVDVIITLPKLKTHGQMTLTAAIKNQFGLVPGALKSQWHFRLQQTEWLASLMLDINRTTRPALALMDAVVGMEGAGPSGGKPRAINALVAGRDLTAVDALACHLIGLPTGHVPTLVAAREQHFGEPHLDHIQVAGDNWQNLRLSDFENVLQPVDVLRLLPLPRPVLRWFRRQWTSRPRIVDGRCTQCGICEDGCPVKPSAIHPQESVGRQVDDDRCIRCYCCHEFCPHQAIELQEPWMARTLPMHRVANGVARVLGWLRGR